MELIWKYLACPYQLYMVCARCIQGPCKFQGSEVVSYLLLANLIPSLNFTTVLKVYPTGYHLIFHLMVFHDYEINFGIFINYKFNDLF